MKQRLCDLNHDDGFTLIEIMAVILIIGILLAVAVATFVPASQAAAAVACRSNQRILADAYRQASYTISTEATMTVGDLASYVNDIDRIMQCPAGEGTLSIDFETGDVTCTNGH